MNLQVIKVRAVRIDAHELHSLVHATHERRSLVAGEVESAAVPQELEQLLEVLVLVRHRSSVPFTNVSSAPGISSSGRMKSTQPVSIAALGIPKNSDVASS